VRKIVNLSVYQQMLNIIWFLLLLLNSGMARG